MKRKFLLFTRNFCDILEVFFGDSVLFLLLSIRVSPCLEIDFPLLYVLGDMQESANNHIGFIFCNLVWHHNNPISHFNMKDFQTRRNCPNTKRNFPAKNKLQLFALSKCLHLSERIVFLYWITIRMWWRYLRMWWKSSTRFPWLLQKLPSSGYCKGTFNYGPAIFTWLKWLPLFFFSKFIFWSMPNNVGEGLLKWDIRTTLRHGCTKYMKSITVNPFEGICWI